MANDLSTSIGIERELSLQLAILKDKAKLYKQLTGSVMKKTKKFFNGQPKDSDVTMLAEAEEGILEHYYNVIEICEFLQQNASKYRDLKKLMKKTMETQAEMKRVLSSVGIDPDDEGDEDQNYESDMNYVDPDDEDDEDQHYESSMSFKEKNNKNLHKESTMTTERYSKLFLEQVDILVKNELGSSGWKGNWKTEVCEDDMVVVSRMIDTVAGRRLLVIRFENGVVYPLVVLSEGFDFEDCSTETQLNLLLSMNEVNRLYSGEITSFIYNENGSTVAVLRGVVCPTFQNEPDFSKDDFDELSSYVVPAINMVMAFIVDINNDFGTDALSDLFAIFE